MRLSLGLGSLPISAEVAGPAPCDHWPLVSPFPFGPSSHSSALWPRSLHSNRHTVSLQATHRPTVQVLQWFSACEYLRLPNTNTNEHSRGRSLPGHGTFSASTVRGWQLAVGGGWQLAVGGGWQLVAGGGWQLAVGGGWQLAVGGGWQLAVGGGWQLAVGGGWQLAVGGGWWRLAVGGGWWLLVPGGLSSTKKKNQLLKDSPDERLLCPWSARCGARSSAEGRRASKEMPV